MRYLILCVLLTLGCQSAINQSDTVSVITEEELFFSGKGSSAGFMLMSSMGASGIAIGIAIDVGIAKEIESALTKDRFSIAEALKTRLSRDKSILKKLDGSTIMIERYGFIAVPSSDDQISPVFNLTIEYSNGVKQDIHFPKDWAGKVEVPLGSLALARVDAKESIRLFEITLAHIADYLKR